MNFLDIKNYKLGWTFHFRHLISFSKGAAPFTHSNRVNMYWFRMHGFAVTSQIFIIVRFSCLKTFTAGIYAIKLKK